MKQILVLAIALFSGFAAQASQPCVTGLKLAIDGHMVTIGVGPDEVAVDGEKVPSYSSQGQAEGEYEVAPSFSVRLPEAFREGPFPSSYQAYVVSFDKAGAVSGVNFEQLGDIDFPYDKIPRNHAVPFKVLQAASCQ